MGANIWFVQVYIFMAESNGDLPRVDPTYAAEYSLTDYVKRRAAEDKDALDKDMWAHLKRLFTKLRDGVANSNGVVVKYESSLFAGLHEQDAGCTWESDTARATSRQRTYLWQAVKSLVWESKGSAPGLIDYKVFSPRHLGSIYEELLSQEFQIDAKDDIVLQSGRNGGVRRSLQSYYTPEEVVTFQISYVLPPKIDDVLEACARSGTDPIEAILRTIKVVDPSMGSGHYLLEATDYISRRISDLVFVDQTDGKQASPITNMISTVQDIRELVMENCIYGVDANAIAVELAKCSLWLGLGGTHSNQRALSRFLEANLRCGDSLVGAVRLADFGAGNDPELRAFQDEFSTIRTIDNPQRLFHSSPSPCKARLLDAAKKRIASKFGIPSATSMFHWVLEFPEVFLANGKGFAAVLGNPPWDNVSAKETDFNEAEIESRKAEAERYRDVLRKIYSRVLQGKFTDLLPLPDARLTCLLPRSTHRAVHLIHRPSSFPIGRCRHAFLH